MPQEGLLLGSALRGLELHLGKGRWEASGAQSHMMPLRGVCVRGRGCGEALLSEIFPKLP